MLVDTTQEMPTGDAMQAMVMANLRQQVGDLAKYINVTVEGGAVTLAGPVENWAERDALLAAAEKTPGVERVVNHTHLRGYRFSW
jgi:osmotically-inducible protein OsmY